MKEAAQKILTTKMASDGFKTGEQGSWAEGAKGRGGPFGAYALLTWSVIDAVCRAAW
ncbi:hypothetical protein [Rubritalea tangerina]|uniref:hypothetical protein n=1 Tax=Rubritalea tangerina TaxID=430798 RepID=UPI00361A868D